MTLEQIERMPKSMLTLQDVAEYLQADPATLRLQAREDPEALGFPIICCGSRTKIPKEGFVHYCRYGRSIIQIVSEGSRA